MRNRVIAAIIVLALFAMWYWGINKLLGFGFVPPVPGWWPATLGPLNPKMAYYVAILLGWLGLTALGVAVIRRLLRTAPATPASAQD